MRLAAHPRHQGLHQLVAQVVDRIVAGAELDRDALAALANLDATKANTRLAASRPRTANMPQAVMEGR
jgi:hypothetical protein